MACKTSPRDVGQEFAAFFADVEEACDSLSNGVLLLRRAMGRAKWLDRGLIRALQARALHERPYDTAVRGRA